MLCQPVAGGEDQAFLLGRPDAGAGPAKVGAGATAYLDEYDCRTVAAYQVDLAALDAEIAFEQPQAVGSQVPGGGLFAGFADLLACVRDNGCHERSQP